MYVLNIKKLCIISFVGNRRFVAGIDTVVSTVASDVTLFLLT